LTGPSLPEDAHGRSYREQHFQYDALDNVRRLETVFADGSANNVTLFGYNPADLTQLIHISHSRPDYPAPVTLEYDALGNLKRDERGNPLHYDALGRLIGVTLPTGQRRWHYGPGGKIIKTEDAAGPRWRYHTSGQLSCEVGETTQTRWVRAGAVPVAESRLASAVREVMLLGTDAQGSITTQAKDQIQTPVYGAYGQSTTEPGASRLGYAGALREQDTGWYFLGDYRIYNPVLMRFHSRDSLSPFGEGGLNGYAYCAGDPVNRIDPSGHAWTDWLLPAAGLVLGMIGTVASLGALAAPAAALTASYVAAVTTATLSVVSLAADVASIVLLTSGNENAGRILGYVGMATGLASAAPSIASAAAKKVKAFGMGVGSLQGRLQHAGGVPGGGRAFNPLSLQTQASRASDHVELWQATRGMNPDGPMRNVIGAINRHAIVDSRTFNAARSYAASNPVPLRLPANNVPSVTVPTSAINPQPIPFFANNPDYVNEVRMIASNHHPTYLPSSLNAAGIDANSLMITSPEVMAGSYNGSAWNMAWNSPELMNMPYPYTYTTWDRSWLQGLSSANNNTWFNHFMIDFRRM
ncbi:RHS repeat-associated core domain-containing protein, partial [Pseudomonas sp. TWR2-1-1]|uniref:RHS repeat-associated core domain-containing protein n=1 Tax=Pseudomonas sp. TWR2-1-1 TaxID=2804610 RepID=UPI003CF3B0E5